MPAGEPCPSGSSEAADAPSLRRRPAAQPAAPPSRSPLGSTAQRSRYDDDVPPHGDGAALRARGGVGAASLACNHSAAQLRRAFESAQAERWPASDKWASAVMVSLLAAGLPRLLRGRPPAARVAAWLVEMAVLATPGTLATAAPSWHASRRNWVVAACRLASIYLLALAMPPTLPPPSAWGGWLRLLAQTRALGLPLFAFANRLPVSWLAWVQLAGTVEAARVTYRVVCPAPAFGGQAALRPLRAAAAAIEELAFWSPLPSPLPSPDLAADAACGGAAGVCLCRRVTLWVLFTLGYAMPVTLQYLRNQRRLKLFVLSRCRQQPGCSSCARLAAPDLTPQLLSGSLLLAAVGAFWWQLLAVLPMAA